MIGRRKDDGFVTAKKQKSDNGYINLTLSNIEKLCNEV